MMMTRKEQIAALYARESRHLQATVRRQVARVDMALVEDACAYAWTALVRRQDVDPDGETTFGWLVTVAAREGWRLAREQTANAADTGAIDRPDTGADVELTAEARHALALLDQLKPQQAQALRLIAAGLSYNEICAVLDQSYTWVNRHVTEGRQAIRRLRDEA